MKITYTFRQMEPSEELRKHSASKLERLERFEDREMVVQVTFVMEKFLKTVEFQATGAYGTFVASETREDMFEAIDVAMDKLDRQLSRDKSKRKHHKGGQATTPNELS